MKRARLFSVFYLTPSRKQDRSFARWAVAFATKILWRRRCFGERSAQMESWFTGTRYLRRSPQNGDVTAPQKPTWAGVGS